MLMSLEGAGTTILSLASLFSFCGAPWTCDSLGGFLNKSTFLLLFLFGGVPLLEFEVSLSKITVSET